MKILLNLLSICSLPHISPLIKLVIKTVSSNEDVADKGPRVLYGYSEITASIIAVSQSLKGKRTAYHI